MSDKPSPKKGSHRTERNFGLLVGGAFAALGLWWIFRHRFIHVAPVLAALGTVLLALGVLVPRLLVWPNRAWMAMAEGMSHVMTPVIMAIVFFLTVTPIGIFRRMVGADPLRRRAAAAPSYWAPYPERQRDPRHYEKMY